MLNILLKYYFFIKQLVTKKEINNVISVLRQYNSYQLMCKFATPSQKVLFFKNMDLRE